VRRSRKVVIYMREALNSLHKFWKEAFTNIKDGRYLLSNNLAERAVRPFTTKRKNSLHFGSDEGLRLLPYTIA